MPWVRMDDQYPEHPKVDRVGPYAAWLNVCAWAYCARNLTDGFVPSERVARLANVPQPAKLAKALVEARLWEAVEGGYMVHDFLAYNPSREQVLKERAATAKRVSEHRERVSNGVTPPDTNGGGNGRSTPVGNGVSTDAPYPSRTPPVPSQSTLRENSPPAPNGAPPRGSTEPPPRGNSRVQAVIDAFRENGYEPPMGPRDYAAIKRSTAPPGLIVEAFMAVQLREYGDDFMRKRLSVHEAIDWVPGYCEHRLADTYDYDAEVERLRELGLNIGGTPTEAESGDADERCPECQRFGDHRGECSKGRMSA